MYPYSTVAAKKPVAAALAQYIPSPRVILRATPPNVESKKGCLFPLANIGFSRSKIYSFGRLCSLPLSYGNRRGDTIQMVCMNFSLF
jgi:hypothetical protein